MYLGDLPLVGLQLIFSGLSASDLALLNATFDSRVRRVISTPNFISELTIYPQTSGSLLYLIRCLRNVNTVTFATQHLGSCDLVSSLISTLNPTELIIKSKLVGLVSDNTNWSTMTPRLGVLRVLNSSGLIGCNFPPTLTRLDMMVDAAMAYTKVLPSTLRVLSITPTINGAPFLSFLSVAFTTLLSLEQLVIRHWKTSATQFEDRTLPLPKSVTSLNLKHSEIPPDSPFWKSFDIYNSHLVDVTLEIRNFGDSKPFSLADCLPNTLLSLTLMIVPDDGSHLISSLPRSITSLKLCSSPSEYESQLDAWINGFSSILSTSSSITTLIIAGFKACILAPKETALMAATIRSPHLPPSLTHLEMAPNTGSWEVSLSLSAIDFLPPTLQYLSIPHFALEHVPTLLKRAPRCVLNINRPVPLWSEAFGPDHFPSCWTPTLNLQLLIASIRERYTRLNTHFVVLMISSRSDASFPETTEIIVNECETSETMRPYRTSTLSTSISSSSSSSNVKFLGPSLLRSLPVLSDAFPKLTKLVITIPAGYHIPPSVTHLEVTSPSASIVFKPVWRDVRVLILACEWCPSMDSTEWTHCAPTYIDMPRCKLNGSAVHEWDLKQTEKFVACLHDIKDWELVHFMSAVPSKLRPNMSIEVSYVPTGALLPSAGPNIPSTIDWDFICRETESILAAKMNEPAPAATRSFASFGSSLTPSSKSSTSTPPMTSTSGFFGFTAQNSSSTSAKLGSIISKFFQQRTYTQLIGLRLPRSVTAISVNTDAPCTFGMDPTSTQMANYNLKVPTYHNAFGSHLVSLELWNVTSVWGWWTYLPASLRHLRLHSTFPLSHILDCDRQYFKLDMERSSFPPLQSLVLESAAQNISHRSSMFSDRLLFKFEQLPTTLERLVIKSMPLRLHKADEQLESASQHLNCLKSLYISDICSDTLEHMYRRLVQNVLEEFVIVNCYEKNSHTLAYKPVSAPTTFKYPKLVVCDAECASLKFLELASQELESVKISNTTSPVSSSNPFSSFASSMASSKSGFGSTVQPMSTNTIKKKPVRPIRR